MARTVTTLADDATRDEVELDGELAVSVDETTGSPGGELHVGWGDNDNEELCLSVFTWNFDEL